MIELKRPRPQAATAPRFGTRSRWRRTTTRGLRCAIAGTAILRGVFTADSRSLLRATEHNYGPYAITNKVPLSTFHLTRGAPKQHTSDNGSGSLLHRQSCATCESPIAEWGAAAQDSARYIFYGTFDKVGEQKALDPKGEFFTSRRVDWLVPVRDTFQKREIKE